MDNKFQRKAKLKTNWFYLRVSLKLSELTLLSKLQQNEKLHMLRSEPYIGNSVSFLCLQKTLLYQFMTFYFCIFIIIIIYLFLGQESFQRTGLANKANQRFTIHIDILQYILFLIGRVDIEVNSLIQKYHLCFSCIIFNTLCPRII